MLISIKRVFFNFQSNELFNLQLIIELAKYHMIIDNKNKLLALKYSFLSDYNPFKEIIKSVSKPSITHNPRCRTNIDALWLI